jgi:hypothetical protein
VYFYNAHQVLVELPQGIGGLVLLFDFILVALLISVYFYIPHQVLVGLPQGVDGHAFLFYFSLVYLYNTHQVLVPRRAAPRGWRPCYLI